MNFGLKKDSPQNYTTGCGFLTSVLIWYDIFGALVGSQAYYRLSVRLTTCMQNNLMDQL